MRTGDEIIDWHPFGFLKKTLRATLRRVLSKLGEEDAGNPRITGSQQASESYLRALIEQSPMSIHVFTPEGRSLLVNASWNRLWKLDKAEKREGSNIFRDDQLRATGLLPYVEEGVAGATVIAPPLLYDPSRTGREGNPRWLEAYVHPVKDESGRVLQVALVVKDVTERKELEEKLTHQAFHDSLTGLPNRTLFLDRLEHALARADRSGGLVAVLFLDLDNFKYVNDSLGHEAGDELLVEVSRRIGTCVRPGDTVARLGGDEFTVLLEDVANVAQALHVAERIADELLTPFTISGQELYVSTSIGVTSRDSVQGRSGYLLRDADLALYEAKRKGKARYVVFDPSMSVRVLERLKLEGDLRQAAERGQLRVCYQPKVSLHTGTIVAMEALLRWEHPERGLLAPGDFLAIAEETGLILPIGDWVLRETCRHGRDWRDQHPDHGDLKICVNVSAKQFAQPDFVHGIEETLRTTGLDPTALSLEVAESVLADEAEPAAAKLSALKRLGVHLVVDDFGAGYSSLSRFGSFPADFLKVDRSLVGRLGREPEDKAIVSAVIDLGHALSWKVVAEGVENATQVEHLRRMGCDLAQGYFFSEPIASEEATALLANGPPWDLGPGSTEKRA